MFTSSPESLAAIEQRIAIDKLAKFKGAARVSIRNLEFPHPSRQIDRKAIRQLTREFDGEGCIREEQSHRIPAVIDASTLQAALEKLSLTAETFRAKADDPPFLELRSGVVAPILASNQVDECLDLDKDTKQALREGYSYSAKYTSGEVFRHMRLCHYDNDPLGVQRWRGRFSHSQDKFLEQLLKRPILVTALDSILHIQGIWREFYIGSLDVILFPKCDEVRLVNLYNIWSNLVQEIAHYINSIKALLARIFDGNMTTMMHTNPMTIESIQSRCPALSKSDYEFIEEKMGSGELCPELIDPAKRADITRNLLSCEELIPSLYTLIKDIRYLKHPANHLSRLLPASRKKSLRQRWFHIFAGTGSNDGGVTKHQRVLGPHKTVSGGVPDSFDVCYQQLWLCSYRICKYPNAYGRLQLAELAHRLGFSTPKIEFELTQDPAQIVIKNALRDVFHTLRPNEKFNFDANKADPVIATFKGYINSQETTNPKLALPSITVNGNGAPLSCRCGQSKLDDRDLVHLFLDKIHAPLPRYGRDGDEISSFYVKRSRHIAFFGAIDLTGNQEGPSNHLSSASSSLDHPQPETSRSAVEPTGCIPSVRHPSRSPDEGFGRNQVVVYKERVKEGVVRFIEKGAILGEVPFREEDVNSQAKEYADQGKKLFLEQGPYFIWHDCYEILKRTKRSAVTVTTVAESWVGKRRRGEDLPERLQPATKEAFDFPIDEDEDEEL
ncbi:uncharacterized protein RSE6_15146 [Rhynchosporium secalis]|uniref:Uncharacterized protein n=1 Tax=Rhynchosporium secalis TaxID=38038 RepID=A0A1E1MWX3_RHYSE|nr:uncharacterized protein RSE6_15146 [Rhynchosporium secalis]